MKNEKEKQIQILIEDFIQERKNYDLETKYSKVKTIYELAKSDMEEQFKKANKQHLFDDREKHDLLVFLCKNCCDEEDEDAYDVYYALRVDELIFD